MAHVGFFVHGKIGQCPRLGDSVKSAQPGNFLRGNFGDLRFVSVKCGHRLCFGSLGGGLVIGIEQRGDSRQRTRAIERRFAHAKGFRELPPQHRVRRRGIEFLGQVFLHQLAEFGVAIGAAGELLQVLRERAHVLIILFGVQRQRFARKLALGPGLIKRVLQQVVLFDERVERFEQSLRAVLGHLVLLILSRIMAVRQNHDMLQEFRLESQPVADWRCA